MKRAYKSIFFLFFSLLLLQTFASAETTIEYKIDCCDYRFEDDKVIIDYIYSAPPAEDTERFVGVAFQGSEDWKAFGAYKQLREEESIDISGSQSFSMPQLKRSFPAGMVCEYYAEIEVEDTGECFRSGIKTLTVPGECPEITNGQTIAIQSGSESYSVQWFSFTAPKRGWYTFTLLGESGYPMSNDSSRLTAYKPSDSLLGLDLMDEDGKASFNLLLEEGGSIYLKCEMVGFNGIYTLNGEMLTSSEKIISVDANGGIWDDGSTEPQTCTVKIDAPDSTVHLKMYSESLLREGFILTGWNTAADGSGDEFGSLDTVPVFHEFPSHDTIVLYAQWEQLDLPEKYFAFILPEGSFDDGRSYLIVDRTSSFEIPEPFKDGYTFVGWQSDSLPNSWSITNYHLFADGTEIVDKNLYLYPIWANNGSKATWLIVSPNGGILEGVYNASGIVRNDLPYYVCPYENVSEYDDYDTHSLNALLNIEKNYLKHDGYVFAGWNTEADGSGTQYASGEFVPAAGLKTFLYAQWKKADDSGSSGGSGGGSSGSSSSSGGGGTSNSSQAPDKEQTTTEDAVGTSFYDVPDDYWAVDAIDFVVSLGLFNGTSEIAFSPDETMTRQMLMTVLARLDGADTKNSPYAQGMAWAIENGISDGSNPTSPITRQQLATVLWRYARLRGYDTDVAENNHILFYNDVLEIGEYAVDAVRWATSKGIMGGYSDNTLRPRNTATRAQVAVMLQRFVSNH